MTEGKFPSVSSDLNFPRDEGKILDIWREKRIFERSIEIRRDAPSFVFYEGPPTANGTPHNGHVLTRVMKDIFPRYKTMRGFRVPRKAGWDTHGLPVEVEVEKELHIHGKAAIEAHGIEPFTERCIESVFRYTTEWEKLTERIGFWVDLDAYVTYHRSYVESVWWALAELFRRGLLYQGHKVVWWWAQGGTALSSAEVGLGYKSVDDPSLFVSFELIDAPPGFEGASLAVWTTTPWTLPSNMYAAVKADAVYVAVEVAGKRVIVAQALAAEVAKKTKGKVVDGLSIKGSELAGKRYKPPFDLYAKDHAGDLTKSGVHKYWRVLAEDFVTLDTGTGIVHIAPAFGEDDHRALQRLQRTLGEPVDLFCAVNPDGSFVPELVAYAGRWVKDCDKDIQRQLKEEGKVLFTEQYKHDYPFCWRSDADPLIQFARPAWYIRTTQLNERALANNRAVNWLPDHIKEGRFGDFLRNNVDWALSRERFWGTPLPIWQNTSLPEDHPQRFVAVESLAELRAQKGCNLDEVEAAVKAAIGDEQRAHHLLIHKPWIDRVTFEREGVEGTYRRVPEVIDCWFDSGCMPFAQWGFPHADGSHEKFQKAFPADFISEAIDQTRGWFYSLLMISTLLFDETTQRKYALQAGSELPHPYRTCIVLGHVCDKNGIKESKQKGNYTPPDVILDRVRMDFAAIDVARTTIAGGKPGVAFIAAEDYEGLDLGEASAKKAVEVKLYRPDQEGGARMFSLLPVEKFPRRIVALHADDLASFGVTPTDRPLEVRPVGVLKLPVEVKVTVEDPHTPSPGSDAFRWFFFASSPPWTNTRHSLSNVRIYQKDFLVKLRNVFSFFTIYANIDRWAPGQAAPAVGERPLLCRWILSELALTTREVTRALDDFRSFDAAQRLMAFVEALSNWYVRRSRERFWAKGVGEAMDADKAAAYATLYTCLVQFAKLIAPFTPFLAEEMYQGLVVKPGVAGARESVHLEDYPVADESLIDAALSGEMEAVRELVSLGLQVRTSSKLKVRQPLSQVDVVLSRKELRARVAPHVGLVLEELNVKKIELLDPGTEGKALRYRIKPNFKVMGPKVGKKVQRVKQLLDAADAGAMRAELASTGQIKLDVDGDALLLGGDDIEISVEAAEGFAAAGGKAGVIVLHTTLDQDLLDEGLSRELQSRLQAARKEMGLGFTDRVSVALAGSERLRSVVAKFRGELEANVLITRLDLPDALPAEGRSFEGQIDGEEVAFVLKKA